MEIETARCRLRPWRSTDLAALLRHRANPNITRNLSNLLEEDFEGWLASRMSHSATCRDFAIETGGELVGGIGVRGRDDILAETGELGFWLAEDFWGRGYMSEVVPAITAYAFETLGCHRLEANHFAWNPASGRVLEKSGFKFEGCLRERFVKQGEYADCYVYGLLRDEFSASIGKVGV